MRLSIVDKTNHDDQPWFADWQEKGGRQRNDYHILLLITWMIRWMVSNMKVPPIKPSFW